MFIYVNGDSHTAGAEAVVPYCFACDESNYFYMGRAPHPENAMVAWPKRIESMLKTAVFNNSESASSNDRIIRTTREWLDLKKRNDLLVIIQWSTWEREEWEHNGETYQVTASGTDEVPEELVDRYKNWIADLPHWDTITQQAHEKIWAFHQELEQRGIPHVFFGGNWNFEKVREHQRKDWGASYIEPYNDSMTFHAYLQSKGHQTVSAQSWHYGPKAHVQWSNFIVQYLAQHKMV